MEISEQTKIEANIGFTLGILVGALAAWVFLLFFVSWAWYFKLFSSIGSAGIVGSLLLSLNESFKARRNLLDVMVEFKKEEGAVIPTEAIKKDAQEIVDEVKE